MQFPNYHKQTPTYIVLISGIPLDVGAIPSSMADITFSSHMVASTNRLILK